MFPEFVSLIGTIMVQAFVITLVGNIIIDCVINLLKHKKRGRKLREYTCSKCGFRAWALDHIIDTNCHQCGANVKTEPVPEFEGSSVCNVVSKKVRKNVLRLYEK